MPADLAAWREDSRFGSSPFCSNICPMVCQLPTSISNAACTRTAVSNASSIPRGAVDVRVGTSFNEVQKAQDVV